MADRHFCGQKLRFGNLKAMHKKIKRSNLPIDILVCSNTLKRDDHLVLIKPLCEDQIPLCTDQPVRIPIFVELHNLFHEREYETVICSIEGGMGAYWPYLKFAYSVKESLSSRRLSDVLSEVLNFDWHNRNSVRRFLRMYYDAFDLRFILNRDQRKWLTCSEMIFTEESLPYSALGRHNFQKQKDHKKEDARD